MIEFAAASFAYEETYHALPTYTGRDMSRVMVLVALLCIDSLILWRLLHVIAGWVNPAISGDHLRQAVDLTSEKMASL